MRSTKQPIPIAMVRLVARLLPRETRERIFEPAVADLVLDHNDPTGRPRGRAELVAASLVLVIESFRLGLPDYIWRSGRMTRFGKAMVLLLLIGSGIIVLLSQLSYGSG